MTRSQVAAIIDADRNGTINLPEGDYTAESLAEVPAPGIVCESEAHTDQDAPQADTVVDGRYLCIDCARHGH